MLSRPAAGGGAAYRDHVDAAVLELLARRPLPNETGLIEAGAAARAAAPRTILTDVKHLFSRNP